MRHLLSRKSLAGIADMMLRFYPHTCTLTPPDVYPDTSTNASIIIRCSMLETFRQEGTSLTDYATMTGKRINVPGDTFPNAEACRGYVISNVRFHGAMIEQQPMVIQSAMAVRADGAISAWQLNLQGYG